MSKMNNHIGTTVSDAIRKYAMEARDVSRIEKLWSLTDKETFYEDVRKLTKRITSDHGIRRWQILADIRAKEMEVL